MRLTLVITALVSLLIFGVLQQALAPRIIILGAQPDFFLILIGCLGLWLSRAGGAVVGFLAGLIHGAIAFANITHYIVSRTVSGFLGGWANDAEFQASAPTAAFATFFITIFGQLLLMFFAPPPAILPYLGDTIRTALYNGVLAVPVYALLRLALGPATRQYP